MTETDLKALTELKPGDTVRNKFSGQAYTVTSTEGGKITAVRTIELTKPAEWVLLHFSKDEPHDGDIHH